MNPSKLETAQLLSVHPFSKGKKRKKEQYIHALDYFVQKFSADDIWAEQTLQLYAHKFLDLHEPYEHQNYDFAIQSPKTLRTFSLFIYRYCFLMDAIYLCAYQDKEKGEKIFTEFTSIYNARSRGRMRKVFDFLYDTSAPIPKLNQISGMAKCWKENCDFTSKEPYKVIVTANMSAGKSTLLNAMVGRRISRTQNDACTAKIHYIENKPYDDGYCYELDHDLVLDANSDILMDDNPNNRSPEIRVGTYFRSPFSSGKRIWLIDTPGVNSAENADHREITEKAITYSNADLMVYVLNGTNIGTEDDLRHLKFVLQNYHKKILFVVNKVDRFKTKEDSISKMLQDATEDLKRIGFTSPCVVPVSAYAAYLARMHSFQEYLDEDAMDERDLFIHKLKKSEYQLDMYYPKSVKEKLSVQTESDDGMLLLHSGLLSLEDMIYNMR